MLLNTTLASTFPNEILLMIFSEADIPTLLSLCNSSKRFRRLANICLVDKFKQQNIGLTLNFGQEHRLRSNITMEFHHVNENNGNFVFQPKEDIQLKFYHSPMLKNPKIYKVTPTQDINTTTNRDGNLLQQSVGISIKTREGISQKLQYVYRIGNGNSHLKVPFAFTYSSIDIPPPNETKSRGGERWVTPLSFECPPSFFYPNEDAVHRILMSVMNYKPNTKKQQTIKKTDCCLNAKQKQRISIQLEPQIQEQILQQIPEIKKVHEEKKKLFKISSKWVRGARY